MKPILIALTLLSADLYSTAQVKIQHPPPIKAPISKDVAGASDKVEVEAGFAGGDTAWRSFLMKNLNVDDLSDQIKFPKSQKIFNQTAVVQLIVCTDGSLCNIQTENKVNPLIKAEVESVMKASPNWVPAIVDGKPVKAYRRQPITILIERE